MTNEQHNKYLAFSFFAYAGFQIFFLLLMFAWMFFVFSSIPSRPGDPPFPMPFFGVFFGIMFVFQMIFTAPSVIAGYGLLKKRKWARIAGIVGAVTAAMSVPIGTAVCVYALWFLLGDQWKEIYENRFESQNYGPLGLNEPTRWQAAGEESFHEKAKEPQPSDWR